MDAPSADSIGTRAFRPRLVASEWIALGGVGAALTAAALSAEGIDDGPVVCPFRLLTGLPCPGCGLTRAWVYLTHGQWHDSFLANPFGGVLLALVLALVVAVIAARVRKAPPVDLEALIRRPWLRAIFAAWLVFSVVRLVVVAT